MIKKARIDQTIYDVVDFSEFSTNPDLYSPTTTAILDGETLFPVRSKTDTRPGLHTVGPVAFFVKPEPGSSEEESLSSKNIIDFDDTKTIKDVIEKQNALRTAERSILTTIDNIFVPEINPNDTPEMKGFKEAIIEKQIDIDKYAQRFGENFNNDKRLLKKESITLSKLKSMMGVLDMKGTLIIEDKSPDVPNPIGKKIVVELTTGEEDSSNESK